MSSGVDRGHLLTEQANPASADLDLLSTSELVQLFCEEDLRPQQAVAGAAAELSAAIDAAGGIPFLLQTPLRYQDKAGGLNINLEAGQQWLSGEQALQLLRLRGTGSEGARRQRQQELLLPIAERLGDPAVVPLLPELLQELNNTSSTNNSNSQLHHQIKVL